MLEKKLEVFKNLCQSNPKYKPPIMPFNPDFHKQNPSNCNVDTEDYHPFIIHLFMYTCRNSLFFVNLSCIYLKWVEINVQDIC